MRFEKKNIFSPTLWPFLTLVAPGLTYFKHKVTNSTYLYTIIHKIYTSRRANVEISHLWCFFGKKTAFSAFFKTVSVCLSVRPSVRLSDCLSVCLSACLSVSVSLSVCMYVCMTVCMYVCTRVRYEFLRNGETERPRVVWPRSD